MLLSGVIYATKVVVVVVEPKLLFISFTFVVCGFLWLWLMVGLVF
jgi:hypothetical protein